MIDSELRDDLLDGLHDLPAELRTLIAGVETRRLTRAGPDAGWGVIENFCHLRDWDMIFAERVERILTEDVPALAPVDDQLWPLQREYHQQDPYAVLETFAAGRLALVSRLDGLEPAQWLRQGIHPSLGRRSLHWFTEQIAAHDHSHAAQIRAALE